MGSWRKILYGGSSDASNSGNITAVDLAVSPGSNKFLKTTSTGILSWASPSLSGDVPFSRLGIIGDTPASGAINPTAYVSDRQNTDSTIELLGNFSSAPSWVDENETVYSYDAVFCKVTNNFYALTHGYSEGETFPIFHYNMSESSFNGLFIAEALDNVFYVIRHQTSNTSTLNEAPTDFDDNEEAIDDSSNIKAWSFDEEGAVDSQYTVNTSSSLGNYFTDLNFMENLDLLQIEGVANQTTSTRYSTILDTLGGTISGPRITIGTVQDIATDSNVRFESIKIAKNSTIELAKTGSDVPYLQNPSLSDDLLLSAPADGAIIELDSASVDINNTLSLKGSSHKVMLDASDSMSENISFTLPSADGLDGQVLVTDGNGALSFSNVSGTTPTYAGLTVSGGAVFNGNVNIGLGRVYVSDNGAHAPNYAVPKGAQSADEKFLGHDTNGIPEWQDIPTLTQEEVEDYAGALIANASGTHTGITITYQDATNDMDFVVDDTTKVPLAGDVTITGDIHMDDDVKIEFGDAGEYIKGDGTNLIISSTSNVDFNDSRLINIARLSFNDGGPAVDIVRDEDDMTSNDANALATQQSVKAYVDNTIRDIRASGFNYQPQVGTKVYIPLGATTSESTILSGGNEWRHFVVPFDGYLDQVIIRSEEACGSTDVALHKSSTGTEVPSSTASATVTVDMTTDDTAYKFDFTSNNTFSAGDIIAISFDPTNDANDTNATVVLVYDGSQGV